MLLHLVSKSPESATAFDSCLRAVAPGAVILLLGDGVYGARQGSAAAKHLAALDNVRCFALAADIEARGLGDRLAPHIESVDYAGFVRLSEDCHAVQSWY